MKAWNIERKLNLKKLMKVARPSDPHCDSNSKLTITSEEEVLEWNYLQTEKEM